jgi:tetratricopeptide (TPR) repeat protein
VALSQGRYDQALAEFTAARKLDANDVGVLFSIGVCHRKLNQFEEATRVFGEVAKVDPDLPGLPLERGLLLEQSGRTEEALREYESALAKAPDDPDLALRVGCSRVAAGDGAGARPLLGKVLEKRSHSAEAHHCLGRAYFLEDKFLEALQSLQRATELDPNRAEYFVYVAVVANAAGQVALAQQSVDVALQKDQGLGDAYWQKGVLLLRQGAALDALQAFDKALELRPSRYEVHADRAQAYYQLGKEVEALSEWRRALEHEDDNATWHFRFGKLLAARRMNREALPHLLRAIELGEKRAPTPPWLWQVHQLAASTLGPTAAALPHWRKFLEQSPEDSPYRDEAKQALARAGQAWTGP